MRRRLLAAAAVALVALPAVTSADTETPAAALPVCGGHAPGPADNPSPPAAEILAGYGTGGFAIRTKSPEAQAFFNNGMQLGHAFAHKAAISAFQQARRLDPDCAMCAWGEAWARGPTINYTIDKKAQAELAGIAGRAAALATDGPEKERQLTAALQLRYRGGGGAGRGDHAFAKAMDAIAHAYPDDNELAILAADAWMIPSSQKNSRDNLDKALALLGGALTRNPKDTGAIHFYIHATEMDGVPERALPFAERLQSLAPAASHLTHMPSHTYYWVGRYAAAVQSNLDAVALDNANAARLKAKGGVWGLSYHSHNVMFGEGAALMDGDAASALALARPALAHLQTQDPSVADDQLSAVTAYFAEGRYGDQAEVAALPDPGAKLQFARAFWRYARAEAAARRGDLAALKAEAGQVRVDPAAYAPLGDWGGMVRSLMQVSRLVLDGRAAMLDRRPADAARIFAEAAQVQERSLKTFTDPPLYWYPVRRSLAAADLAAGRPADAAREAQAVLARTPNDAMALLVLARADRALGQGPDADKALADARKAWRGDLPELGPAGV